jgi:hypothetical protein
MPKAKSGQGCLRKDGYRIMTILKNGQKKRILEHHIIMSDHIGRELYPHENVHHRNGNRSDNRIENLELWSTSQPNGQKIEDKIKWAKEFINLYS